MSHLLSSLSEVCLFVALVVAVVAAIEAFLYVHLKFFDRRWFIPVMLVAVPAAVAALIGFTDMNQSVEWLPAVIASLVAEAGLVFLARYVVRGQHSVPIMFLFPALFGILLLILYPLVFEVYLSFFDLKLSTLREWVQSGSLPFVGFKHFINVFKDELLPNVGFWQLLGRTGVWTIVNVSMHVVGGFGLALLLNRKIKFKGFYRTLLVIPWAMPQVVAILAMRGEFHAQFGFVNIMLQRLGFSGVDWLSQHAFLTCCLINFWLGIPFMMVVILGGLQSIPQSYYEAASIDGASAFQQFRKITLPLIRPVLAPTVTLGAIWTFNNVNVIYLVTGQGGGNEDADIIVSAIYKAAFTYNRYSYSAAFALVVFLVLLVSAGLWLKITRGTESIYE